ncbi:hypothetical protein PanWU01x14_146680, partial [Parasponia andersonii]
LIRKRSTLFLLVINLCLFLQIKVTPHFNSIIMHFFLYGLFHTLKKEITKTFCESERVREREREYTVLQDVGLGASFRGGGLVHTPNTGFVDSDSRQKQMRRVW